MYELNMAIRQDLDTERVEGKQNTSWCSRDLAGLMVTMLAQLCNNIHKPRVQHAPKLDLSLNSQSQIYVFLLMFVHC